MKIIIGIDPGLSGAIAILDNEYNIMATTAMLMHGNQLDLTGIADWIERSIVMDGTPIISCIEKVASMPGQGVKSVWTFGFNTGVIHGILATFEIPRFIVAPNVWQKSVLSFTNKGDKQASVNFCRRVYPHISLLATERSKKPHTGIADAICIARYAIKTQL